VRKGSVFFGVILGVSKKGTDLAIAHKIFKQENMGLYGPT